MYLQKDWIIYIAKVLLIFCVLFYGTEAMIGLQAPGGGYYSPFLDKYLNYINWLRSSIMHGTKWLMQMLGYKMYMPNFYTLKIQNANGIAIGTGCLGYGVMSCWIALITANKGDWKFKAKWVLMGLLLIQFCNCIRMSLILLAGYKHWPTFNKISHHDFFNYMSYGVVILLMLWHQKTLTKNQALLENEEVAAI